MQCPNALSRGICVVTAVRWADDPAVVVHRARSAHKLCTHRLVNLVLKRINLVHELFEVLAGNADIGRAAPQLSRREQLGYRSRMWRYTGQERPDFAAMPGPGQESVWDYPRPPRLAPTAEEVEVRSDGLRLAFSTRALRVLETASPPTYYLPGEDVDWDLLRPLNDASFCEWKGRASYFALAGDSLGAAIAWRYLQPRASFAAIDGHVSFYPGRVPCFVDGERVRPQPGQFYGGWVTDRVVGPFKGEPGTGHW